MRCIPLLLLGATLASCATPPPDPTMAAKSQRQFQEMIAGRVAGPPQSCMPTFASRDMTVLDDNTIAFKTGGKVYVAHMLGGCTNASGPYSLVTRQVGSSGLCHGDIASVVDLHNNFTVGSCVFGDFTPYTRTGR